MRLENWIIRKLKNIITQDNRVDYSRQNNNIITILGFIVFVSLILFLIFPKTTMHETKDELEKEKKENGDYAPNLISETFSESGGVTTVTCKSGYKTGPIKLKQSGLLSFRFQVSEIRLQPIGSITVIIIDKENPKEGFFAGEYFIYVPQKFYSLNSSFINIEIFDRKKD